MMLFWHKDGGTSKRSGQDAHVMLVLESLHRDVTAFLQARQDDVFPGNREHQRFLDFMAKMHSKLQHALRAGLAPHVGSSASSSHRDNHHPHHPHADALPTLSSTNSKTTRHSFFSWPRRRPLSLPNASSLLNDALPIKESTLRRWMVTIQRQHARYAVAMAEQAIRPLDNDVERYRLFQTIQQLSQRLDTACTPMLDQLDQLIDALEDLKRQWKLPALQHLVNELASAMIASSSTSIASSSRPATRVPQWQWRRCSPAVPLFYPWIPRRHAPHHRLTQARAILRRHGHLHFLGTMSDNEQAAFQVVTTLFDHFRQVFQENTRQNEARMRRSYASVFSASADPLLAEDIQRLCLAVSANPPPTIDALSTTNAAHAPPPASTNINNNNNNNNNNFSAPSSAPPSEASSFHSSPSPPVSPTLAPNSPLGMIIAGSSPPTPTPAATSSSSHATATNAALLQSIHHHQQLQQQQQHNCRSPATTVTSSSSNPQEGHPMRRRSRSSQVQEQADTDDQQDTLLRIQWPPMLRLVRAMLAPQPHHQLNDNAICLARIALCFLTLGQDQYVRWIHQLRQRQQQQTRPFQLATETLADMYRALELEQGHALLARLGAQLTTLCATDTTANAATSASNP
ncbi:hypothetical protein BC940DRAFT_349029 [Gongronella butleri]|nr:hypothetical protein BC940DRAFT_349029 [Gongronella butleri]